MFILKDTEYKALLMKIFSASLAVTGILLLFRLMSASNIYYPVSIGVLILATVISIVLTARGYQKIAIRLFTGMIFTIVGLNMFIDKGLADASILAFPALIILTGFLNGSKSSVFLTGLSVLTILGIYIIEPFFPHLAVYHNGIPNLITIILMILCSGAGTYFLVNTNDKFYGQISSHKKQIQDQNEKLHKQLEFQETLMNELHHRVKNNLSIISSFLFLQQHNETSASSRAALEESINRIQAIAKIHEHLSKQASTEIVNMKKYFSFYIGDFMDSFNSSHKQLDISVEIEDLDIFLKDLVSMALIINELLTNSMKYAFLGKNSGSVVIGLSKQKNGLKLSYQDNGPGFVLDSNNPSSLGLNLIKIFCDQLQGQILAKKDRTAPLEIIFPESLVIEPV